jgi:hypothetical protein
MSVLPLWPGLVLRRTWLVLDKVKNNETGRNMDARRGLLILFCCMLSRMVSFVVIPTYFKSCRELGDKKINIMR